VVFTVGFLVARILIDREIHMIFARKVLKNGSGSSGEFIGSVLFLAYGLSLFFPNTIVVLGLIPMLKSILEPVENPKTRSKLATLFVLAIIYGSNIGGMGSMTGASSNVLFIGFIELNNMVGKEKITFFSWLLAGVPVTFILLLISRFILRCKEKEIQIPVPKQNGTDEEEHRTFVKYATFFVANIALMFSMTAVQFFLKPKPIAAGLNFVDWFFVIYLGCFLFFSFFLPKGRFTFKRMIHNLMDLLLMIILFPFIFISELWDETRARFGFVRHRNLLSEFIDRFYSKSWNTIEKLSGGRRRIKRIKDKSRREHAFVSPRKLVFDLPFFGLTFMLIVVTLIILLLKIGDNPATPAIDGYIATWLQGLAQLLIESPTQQYITLLILITAAVFLTEIMNNTTVMLITFSLFATIQNGSGISPILFMLAVTVASTAAFMSPLASPVNAVAFAGLKDVSLKKMLVKGLCLNIMAALYLALIFYLGLSFF
jgi:sodium-dependent dicarboxylate transporter 2/3/5